MTKNKIHPARSVPEAEQLLEQLGLNWDHAATPKLSSHRDPIANQNRESYGNATHFVTAENRAIASFVQETQALVIYDKPRRVAKLFYNLLNVRRRNGVRQVPIAAH